MGMDYGPQSLDRAEELARRAALREGIDPRAQAAFLAAQRALDEERAARALEALVRPEEISARLRASADGYQGDNLMEELLLADQGPARKLAEGEARARRGMASRRPKRKRTLRDYWDMIAHKVTPLANPNALGKKASGTQVTPGRNERSVLSRNGMRAVGSEPWPTRRVPSAILNHEDDFTKLR